MTPITRAELVEMIALQLDPVAFNGDTRNTIRREHACIRGRDILTAIHDAGLAVVPAEPTEEMLAASEREWDGRMRYRSTKAFQAVVAAGDLADAEF